MRFKIDVTTDACGVEVDLKDSRGRELASYLRDFPGKEPGPLALTLKMAKLAEKIARDLRGVKA